MPPLGSAIGLGFIILLSVVSGEHDLNDEYHNLAAATSSKILHQRSILEQHQHLEHRHHHHHQSSLRHQNPPDEEDEEGDIDADFHETPRLEEDGHFLVETGGPRQPDKEYLDHSVAEQACRLDRGSLRKDRLNNTYLSFCSRYKMESLLSTDELMSVMHTDDCNKILDNFIRLDEGINTYDNAFRGLLRRYNCHNGYSVKWNCEDCKKAYKDWLCATSLSYYMNGERVKPCISFCERVEQRCPYLHPIFKEQYGGQPVFICRDPNIPFVPEITPDIPYSEPAKCYDLCHLSDNITELITDSLSKYQYNECPEKSSIAVEVRNDPHYYGGGKPSRASNETSLEPNELFKSYASPLNEPHA